jgi:hypothetical protein
MREGPAGKVRWPRFGRVREEKSGKLAEGGDPGKTPTQFYQRISARCGAPGRKEQKEEIRKSDPLPLVWSRRTVKSQLV